MGILGIANRTENWKTAQTFAPFFADECARKRLVTRLLEPLGQAHEAQAGTVKIELFWYGMRDWIHQTDEENKIQVEAIASSYEKPDLFRDLRESIHSFRAETSPKKFMPLQPHNYNVAEENWEELFNNTQIEIDIVLESQNHLSLEKPSMKKIASNHTALPSSCISLFVNM